jgi:hypothetical protein
VRREKAALTRWFWAMPLLTRTSNGNSSRELQRDLGVCYKTSLRLEHTLMEAMRIREEPRLLTGRVEMDDAYLGGQRLVSKSRQLLGQPGDFAD